MVKLNLKLFNSNARNLTMDQRIFRTEDIVIKMRRRNGSTIKMPILDINKVDNTIIITVDSVSNESAKKVKELKNMPYDEYLKTDHWQEVRKRKLKQVGYKCQRCGVDNIALEVHHIHYRGRGKELLKHLLVLCRNCHENEHGIKNS